MKIVPLFGGGTFNKSAVVTHQRRLNCYVELRPDKDKTKTAIYGTPGLSNYFEIASVNTPARALLGTESYIYIVVNTQLYVFDTTLNVAFSGLPHISSGANPVSITNSSTQVVLTDGFNGYVYTPATFTFALIVSNFPAGAKTVTFVSGFFVAEQPGTQKFWVSNYLDATTWNALAFASAASDSDNVKAVDRLSTNLLLFCEKHLEFWQNIGTSPQPFAPILSAATNVGIAAVFSRSQVGESLFFLGQTNTGKRQVFRINGYSVKAVSDADMDALINSMTTYSDAESLSYQIDSHRFYQLTFPTENRTILYDDTSGIWSEAQSGTSLTPSRHQGRLSTLFNGKTVVSSYSDGNYYLLDPNIYSDSGVLIPREIITRHILSSFNRIRISVLYLDMETGVGAAAPFDNPQVMLQYSKDNGRTWSAERWVSVGALGQYMTRVIWRRFGSTRVATFKIRMTDPVKFVITEGAMKIRERRQ